MHTSNCSYTHTIGWNGKCNEICMGSAEILKEDRWQRPIFLEHLSISFICNSFPVLQRVIRKILVDYLERKIFKFVAWTIKYWSKKWRNSEIERKKGRRQQKILYEICAFCHTKVVLQCSLLIHLDASLKTADKTFKRRLVLTAISVLPFIWHNDINLSYSMQNLLYALLHPLV